MLNEMVAKLEERVEQVGQLHAQLEEKDTLVEDFRVKLKSQYEANDEMELELKKSNVNNDSLESEANELYQFNTELQAHFEQEQQTNGQLMDQLNEKDQIELELRDQLDKYQRLYYEATGLTGDEEVDKDRFQDDAAGYFAGVEVVGDDVDGFQQCGFFACHKVGKFCKSIRTKIGKSFTRAKKAVSKVSSLKRKVDPL